MPKKAKENVKLKEHTQISLGKAISIAKYAKLTPTIPTIVGTIDGVYDTTKPTEASGMKKTTTGTTTTPGRKPFSRQELTGSPITRYRKEVLRVLPQQHQWSITY